MAEKYKVLHPTYYDKFTCIGGDCEDTCCKGWHIYIDKKTYRKYRNHSNTAFTKNISQNIQRVRGSMADDNTYAEFVLRGENRTCGYLLENGLCGIYAQLGPDYMCTTCQRFPRKVNQAMPDVAEVSLSMSCPEVVRLAVLQPEPIAFVLDEKESITGLDMKRDLNLNPNQRIAPDDPFRHAWDLREACIDILQNKNGPLPERLLTIGIMLNKANDLQQADKMANLSALGPVYSKAAAEGEFTGLLQKFNRSDEAGAAIHSSVFTFIILMCQSDPLTYDYLMELTEDFLADFREQHSAELAGLGENETMNFDFGAPMYYFVEAFAKERWPALLEQYEQALENYFVNFVFAAMFPYAQKDLSLSDNFILLAEQYSILRMLFCHAASKGQLDESRVTRIFTTVSHFALHNQGAKHVTDIYKEKQFDTLAHLSFLLR